MTLSTIQTPILVIGSFLVLFLGLSAPVSYTHLDVYKRQAYKPGLQTTHELDEHFGHPHRQYKTIHIAGTNGKGSCLSLIHI